MKIFSTQFGVFREVTLNSETPYPSISELLTPDLLAKIPSKLAEEITERYSTLGEKYLTDALHTDGRRINSMIFTDRMVNANEEIVDAVFCVVGQIFKDNNVNMIQNQGLYDMLDSLSRVYIWFSNEISNGGYA